MLDQTKEEEEKEVSDAIDVAVVSLAEFLINMYVWCNCCL